MTGETGQDEAKMAPAALELRGRPPRIARFRKSAIVMIAALGSTALAGVSWFALRSPRPAPAVDIAARADRAERTPEVLASAPRGYGEIPRLGEPLPGDLGRPILAKRNEDAAAPVSPANEPVEAAGLERQRLASEELAARRSGVLVEQQHARSAIPIGAQSVPAAPMPIAQPVAAVGDSGPATSTQQHKLDFLERSEPGGDVNPHSRIGPGAATMLGAGSVIAATLLTGLDSDLPGLVTAHVSENAYDSATGRIVLIPQGSRLLGRYDSVIAFGQRRAMVIWQRIVFPDGSSIRIDNWPATDQAGYAGLSDKVDLHSWQLLKGVALSALLGVGTELGITGESDLVEALRETTQRNAARAGDQIVARGLDVQPTIRVRPGWPLRVLVHKDLILPPWETR